MTAAQDAGVPIDYEQGRELVYGMPYSKWKAKYQIPATAEQLHRYTSKGNT